MFFKIKKITKIKPDQFNIFYKEYKNKLLPLKVNDIRQHGEGSINFKSGCIIGKNLTIFNIEKPYSILIPPWSKSSIGKLNYHIAKLKMFKKDWVLFHLKYGK